MKKKIVQTPRQIEDAINVAMANSHDLDGDCNECRARRIGRVSVQEAKLLGRNWNVDIYSGECRGECLEILEQVASEMGKKFEAVWP